mgnify:CR=1 FL=1
MKVTYPFDFNELLITRDVLDKLGFTEYWAGSGDYGTRLLKFSSGPFYTIKEMDSLEDNSSGYSYAEYSANRYLSENFSKSLYFLHDLYEDIWSRRTYDEVCEFVEKTKEVNMYPYIESWINYKKRSNN